ncbi:MAG: AMP-binding protein, partial [Rhodospirillaceae bacterium]|nr:AMP-binding protein [Rhodospirillaceae bacterium]
MPTEWTVDLSKPITSLDRTAASVRKTGEVGDQTPRDGQSYMVGALTPPLLDLTIGNLLAKTARQDPSATAVVFCDSGLRWSYGELKEKSRQLAAGLLSLGFEKGDRIGIWSTNRAEWLLTQFATAEIGLIMVNINPAYRLAELEYALNKVGCKGLILAESFKTSHYLEMLQALAPELDLAEP